jgi:hypothetical protein
MTAKTADLAAIHTSLVAQRKTAGLTAGVAAGISRKIGAVELEMELTGIDYVPYAPEGQSVLSLTDKTNDELTAMLSDLITSRESAETSGRKAQLTRRLRYVEKVLTDRGVKITPWSNPTHPKFTADDIITRVVALRKLLSRGDQVREKIKKLAQDQLTAFENLASDMQVTLPAADAPVAAPAPVSDDQTDSDAIGALDTSTPRKRSRKVPA